jgi:hypothetical protein
MNPASTPQDPDQLISLTYLSTAMDRFGADELADLLDTVREKNHASV